MIYTKSGGPARIRTGDYQLSPSDSANIGGWCPIFHIQDYLFVWPG
jgi:hypothetical protein